MADNTPSDVPPIPIPPIVDLTGTGGDPEEKTVARSPRTKAQPKAVPPAVPPAATVTPVESGPAAEPEAAPAAPNPYAQPNPYAAAPAAQPNAYATPAAATGQPNPYAASAAPQPYAYGPYVPQPPKGLSITSMALGIGGLVFCGTLFLVSVAAVVTGHMAVKRQPHAKGFWLTGIITGYAGIGLGLIWGAVTILPWFIYSLGGSYFR